MNYSVGDKVVITGNAHFSHSHKIGSVGVIEYQRSPSSYHVIVGGTTQALHESDFELATESPISFPSVHDYATSLRALPAGTILRINRTPKRLAKGFSRRAFGLEIELKQDTPWESRAVNAKIHKNPNHWPHHSVTHILSKDDDTVLHIPGFATTNRSLAKHLLRKDGE